ncbi:F0F1 ATP synthase subunit epsilon [Chloroflexota bacterium]
MAPLHLDIVTAERQVFSDEVDIVVAPGVEGLLGILPNHIPLMTILEAGEISAKQGSEEIIWAISGGFLEVKPDRVIVLADTAERDDEIDLARAEEARDRAKQRLSEPATAIDTLRADAALQRSLTRLKVAQKRRRRGGPPTM